MAKKKSKNKSPLTISPEKYILTKARSLPIAECLINEEWKEVGSANIIVSRQHKSGNYTLAAFLVDLYCLGVKDTFYRYNISLSEYNEIKSSYPFKLTTYNEVHNIIYGAIAYAEDLGIDPHPDFNITQYVLEEDSDDIPFIEYEFGKDGKPFLIVCSRKEENKYVSVLNKNVGEGNFDYILRADDYDEDYEDEDYEDGDYYDDEDDYDDDEDDDDCDEDKPFITEEFLQNLQMIQDRLKKIEALPHTKYAYKYPAYPKNLKLNHKELEVFFSPEYNDFLEAETIDSILSLPHETLIEDLENIVLYEIGRTYKKISNHTMDEEYRSTLLHVIFFLGELRSERSLNVILEVLRQNDSFRYYHFGDSSSEVLSLTLYYVGRNQLPALLDFVKEPNLDIYFKADLIEVGVIIANCEPERRQEVIEWYREMLNFNLANISNTAYYDATLVGMIISNLIDIQAVELFPEIKRLYDTNLVDDLLCGSYDEVVYEMNSLSGEPIYDSSLFNIYDRYKDYYDNWS